MSNEKIPLSRALLLILFSTLMVSGMAFMGWLYFLQVREKRLNDPQYQIVAIVQSTTQGDSLKSAYLAELLNLSLDQPTNLFHLNVKEKIKILQRHPSIKSAQIKKIPPGTLYIEYDLRTPIAFLGELSNTVLDVEGVLFPFRPFFTPKRIPILYLGLDQEKYFWGNHLKENRHFQQAVDLLEQFNFFQQNHYSVKKLDMTHRESDSYGQREIVMVLEKNEDLSPAQKKTVYLRLSPEGYTQDLVNFFTLMSENKIPDQKEVVIDLRIAHLAFIKIE